MRPGAIIIVVFIVVIVIVSVLVICLPQSHAWEMQFAARPMWQRANAIPQSHIANMDRRYSFAALRSDVATYPRSKTIAMPHKCP